MQSLTKIKVAVYIITYNHVEFIEKAILSVVQQKTNFEFKIFIGDDCSKDGTKEKCTDLKSKYPNLIDLKLNEVNQGAVNNAINTFNRCYESNADYIAIIEGDDYWIDENKLQKQVDFLDENSNCSFCFHKAFKIKSKGNEVIDRPYPKGITERFLNEKEFFKISTIPTASVVFRSRYRRPEINHTHGDFLLYCSFLSNGEAGYLDESMSVYRLHEGGVSSKYSSNAYIKNRIKELIIEKEYKGFSRKVKKEIDRILVDHVLYYLNKNRGKLQTKEKIIYLKKIYRSPYMFNRTFKEYGRLIKTLIS